MLQIEALALLFAEQRFAWFDFTEGEGQHKRTLASGGVACRDLLLLRPTLANRAAVLAVGGFDGAMALAKRWAQAPALAGIAKRVRRPDFHAKARRREEAGSIHAEARRRGGCCAPGSRSETR